MSKKSERVKFLVGCRNAINHNVTKGQDGKFCYDSELIKAVIETLDKVLELDGIFPQRADSKVGK